MKEPADIKSEAGEQGHKFHGFKKKAAVLKVENNNHQLQMSSLEELDSL